MQLTKKCSADELRKGILSPQSLLKGMFAVDFRLTKISLSLVRDAGNRPAEV